MVHSMPKELFKKESFLVILRVTLAIPSLIFDYQGLKFQIETYGFIYKSFLFKQITDDST